MLNFLPQAVSDEIFALCGKDLCELRIRAGTPIKVTYVKDGKQICATIRAKLNREDIERAVLRLCNFTVFSAEESIRNGFITSREGERVGLCGQCVVKDGKITAIKNLTSLCVRYPKAVEGCAWEFFLKYTDKPMSCLVISPPFQGKTTFIRDLGRLYSDELGLETLYIDERDELSAGGTLYLGRNSDVLSYADKEYAFRDGVRTLNPQVIVCDELMDAKDAAALQFACASGVKVIASVHSDSLKNVLRKEEMRKIIKDNTFDVIAEMNKFKITKVYNGRCEEIWSGY